MSRLVGLFTGSATWFYMAIACFAVGGVASGGLVYKVMQGSIARLELKQAKADASFAETVRLADRANTKRGENAQIENAKNMQASGNSDTAGGAAVAGLRDAIRLGETANASLSSCVERANTLSGLLDTDSELLKRVAREANGHVNDKINCKARWPILPAQ